MKRSMNDVAITVTTWRVGQGRSETAKLGTKSSMSVTSKHDQGFLGNRRVQHCSSEQVSKA
ncbi:hypothetical protein SNOG_07583 [Parastagonospora nodorum SN15]|uniref:Uncharacterized protein n=1 Tax=Phaeosphaeria nodorum (strain SN15 / ATCC MYA-4574 / FGSC 10173) TaxID=321614 RepID=Q0UKY1_PHANO|nr:hypothetical protein SNOG_07583 [Parastagonospora nodorum SN15]EAT85049.1 hypothetical protein SNOG_07583 [Parastagonospora nodorum SN15]